MSPYVRMVKTSSGAVAVQIVYSSHCGSREIEHLESAHDGWGICEVTWFTRTGCWVREGSGRGCGVRQLVLARIIEPSSKLDSARMLEEAGVAPTSYPVINRRLRVYATGSWREKLSAACAARAGLGPASLVLYDVSMLYFENRCRRWVPGAGVPRGAPPGPPGRHRLLAAASMLVRDWMGASLAAC